MRTRTKVGIGGLVLACLAGGYSLYSIYSPGLRSAITGQTTVSLHVTGSLTNSSQHHTVATADNAPPPNPVVINGVHLRYNPYQPSDGAYPQLTNQDHLWIDVSIDQQLVYIFSGSKRLYTMATSSGLDTIPDNSTPLGVFHVQAERGTWFYTQQYNEGASYWVSWLGHGIFLFHSVPMNSKQQVILSVAARLLHKASHGCFHLTIPDAKWVYDNIPYGTAVVVEQSPVYLAGNQIYHPSEDQLQAIQATTSSHTA